MSEAKHSPTPWITDTCYIRSAVEPDGPDIARVYQNEGVSADANSAFIVRACNSFDDLLAACEAMVGKWDAYMADESSVNPADHVSIHDVDSMKAAIDKAKGGQRS